MKTLFIIRHAKSSWDYPGLKDHDRPLLREGKTRTKKIAEYLKKENVKIDIMLSSTAVRAYKTATIIAKKLNYPLEDIIKEPSFYHSDTSDILDHLFALDNTVDSVMIFGHNPTFTLLANKFLNKPLECLPTSAVACIIFDASKWEEIMLAKAETSFVVYPKMLK